MRRSRPGRERRGVDVLNQVQTPTVVGISVNVLVVLSTVERCAYQRYGTGDSYAKPLSFRGALVAAKAEEVIDQE